MQGMAPGPMDIEEKNKGTKLLSSAKAEWLTSLLERRLTWLTPERFLMKKQYCFIIMEY